jgi:hypothetical protein
MLAGLRFDGPAVSDIWIRDLSRGVESQVTSGQGTRYTPVWSADGHRWYFVLRDVGRFAIHHQTFADGLRRTLAALNHPNIVTVHSVAILTPAIVTRTTAPAPCPSCRLPRQPEHGMFQERRSYQLVPLGQALAENRLVARLDRPVTGLSAFTSDGADSP